ncbi:MAG TPA: preprotein translocase subunit SecG [Rectinema sp.]|nr:preprotein translocase subunit SecG [Rectinema sp.]HPG96334.1 preprotein translocase subunit SecG [Rectinema sp.]HPN02632.1 preprotein translocase subunit SecG [Rectinema sp.]
MGFFSILLLVIFVIVCLLLIFFVIIQDEESDSIGGIFASGAQSAFGSRTSNIVVRITYVLGGLFFVIAFSLAILNKSSTGNIQKVVEQESTQTATSEWWNSQGDGDQSVQSQLEPQDQTTQPEGLNTPATK